MENFQLKLIDSVMKDQSTLLNQQMQDANTTIVATNVENDVTNMWNNQLAEDTANLKSALEYLSEHPTSTTAQDDVQSAQATYNEDQATANGAQTEAQGEVTAVSNQAQMDSTNLSSKAQLANVVNLIGSTVVGLLQQSY